MSISKLTIKYQTLSRRVTSLTSELDIWIDRADTGRVLEKNFSQIEVLDYFMRTLCKQNEASLNALDPDGNIDVFLCDSFKLTKGIIQSQVIWDFFRDRLELRFVPQFQQPLLMADLISYDCYTTVMNKAKALRIIPSQSFREYPLVGLVAGFSPVTWQRGQRPPALQNHYLPIPVIDLPWEHLINPWELLTIAHEVGHDVDKDLGKLTESLHPVIANQLAKDQSSTKHIAQWQRWTSEILADIIGILLTGPSFVQVLTGLLTLPKNRIRHINYNDSHPPHYLRVFINSALLRRLGLSQPASDIEAKWKMLYGQPGTEFAPYLSAIEPVISTILDTRLAALQDQNGKCHSISELVTFTPDNHALVQQVATKLATTLVFTKIPIRYIGSASQLAFEQLTKTNDSAKLENLARHTQQAIINLAPPDQLPAGLSPRARQHLDNLVDALASRPLSDFGFQFPSTLDN
ncbi:MAG: hypothetical protein GY833_06110 [Aestuariibacter sp.]|nr:hypothetical protein [Aestuariibacter sp.]